MRIKRLTAWRCTLCNARGEVLHSEGENVLGVCLKIQEAHLKATPIGSACANRPMYDALDALQVEGVSKLLTDSDGSLQECPMCFGLLHLHEKGKPCPPRFMHRADALRNALGRPFITISCVSHMNAPLWIAKYPGTDTISLELYSRDGKEWHTTLCTRLTAGLRECGCTAVVHALPELFSDAMRGMNCPVCTQYARHSPNGTIDCSNHACRMFPYITPSNRHHFPSKAP